MNPSIRLLALAGMIFLSHGLSACTWHQVAPSSPDGASPSASPVTTTTSWAELLGPVSAPDGWQVEPCRNPILLCVRADGEILGTVERFGYPLSEVNLQGGAPKTPEAQRQFLEAWVADHYATIRDDRAGADSNLQFSAEAPEPASVGSLPGLRYGYTITHPNGMVYDRTVGYVATDGTQIYVFVTGVISGDPSGSFSSEQDLATFEPYLGPIMAGLRL